LIIFIQIQKFIVNKGGLTSKAKKCIIDY